MWDGEVVEEVIWEGGNHSSRLARELKRVITEKSWDFQKLDMVAVSIGPGSFTGLRIGLSLAKGISWSLGIPLKGIPTYEVIRENFSPPSHPLIIIIPSRKEEFYFFKWVEGRWEVEGEIVSIDELPRMIEEDSFTLAGEGVPLYQEKLREVLRGKRACFPSASQCIPCPSSLASLAEKGEIPSWEEGLSVSPLYLRLPRIGGRG